MATVRVTWTGPSMVLSSMVLRRAFLVLLVLAGFTGLTGCFGGSGTGGQTPNPSVPIDTGHIVGYVTNGMGGPPVPGATVTAVPAQEKAARARIAGPDCLMGRGSLTTAAAVAAVGKDGRYSLTLKPGSYDVIVSKEDMGTTKAQGVVVRAGETVTVNLPQYTLPDSLESPAAPASLTLAVSGVTPGQIVSGALEVLVEVIEENPSLPVESIEIRVGHESLNPDYVGTPSSPSRILTWSWQTADWGNGPIYIHVSACDAGRNLTILRIPVAVANGLPAAPAGLRVIASTCGENISRATSRAAAQARTMNRDGRQGAPALSIPWATAPRAAPAGGFLAVQVIFDGQPDAKGYRIYRSLTGGDPWVLAGEVRPQEGYLGPGALEFWDADPALSAGRKVFYRVTAYNDAGEGAPTDPVYTIPLPKFNVILTAPADGTSTLSLNPTLSWQSAWEPYGPGDPEYAGAIAAFAELQVQVYQVEVRRSADGCPMWTTTLTASAAPVAAPTQVVYNSDGSGRALEPGTAYEWDVLAYVQVRYSGDSEAFAWSASNGLSVNGPFKFSTGP